MEINKPGVRARELQPHVTQACSPLGNLREAVEWRLIAREQRDEQRWTLIVRTESSYTQAGPVTLRGQDCDEALSQGFSS
jgi:hypothetical protein